MSKLNRKIVYLILGLGMTLCLLIYGWNSNIQAQLTEHLVEMMDSYKEGETSIIDIANINQFEWDNVYIFGQYGTCSNITKTLESPLFWFRCKTSGIENIRGISLFVFTKGGSIVGVANPWNYPVLIEDINLSFSRETAYFIQNDDGYLDIFEISRIK